MPKTPNKAPEKNLRYNPTRQESSGQRRRKREAHLGKKNETPADEFGDAQRGIS